jgi:hypothetical protein
LAKISAWSLFVLGLAHILFGVLRFKQPLIEVVQSGFFSQFATPERRTAFWFILTGPLLMLLGQLAVQAVDAGNLGLLKQTGAYLLVISLVGVAAFPVSPLWALLVLSILLIASGYGWLV